jgi:T4 RnlA family RNA ligase
MTNAKFLYAQLMSLCAFNSAFYFRDFDSSKETVKYRIFNYNLTSYSDFLKPGALESRGTMFVVDQDGEFIGISSRTPKKFFNLGENPLTMNLDLNDPILVMKKEDGSLMSTYLDLNGQLRLKSKGSITSTQCVDAMAFLENNAGLLNDLTYLAKKNFTVNLEWTAPNNRVVVLYDVPALTGLSVIKNETGGEHYIDFVEYMDCGCLAEAWVKDFQYDGDLAQVVKEMGGEEGVVCVTSGGVTCKIKSDWYSALHRNLSSVERAKGMVQVILMEQSDDLKSMFRDNHQLVKRIEAYESVVSTTYNDTTAKIYRFHEGHKALGRKEYAMAAKEYWNAGYEFNIQMSAMCGKDFSSQLKEYMMRNYASYEQQVDAIQAMWRVIKIDPDAFIGDVRSLEREPRTIH